jgi:hypothetical protein
LKTDQRMTLTFDSGTLDVYHRSKRGSLTDVFNIGNKMRVLAGVSSANMSLFINSEKTKAYISMICKKEGLSRQDVIMQQGRGKASRTEAHIHLLIYAAEYLSTEFHYEVIETFINSKILELRDESGDQFKALNMAIDRHLGGRVGKDNKGLFIHVAKALKEKINPADGNWNLATAEQLRERVTVERRLVDYLEMGFIKDWEHLKQVVVEI